MMKVVLKSKKNLIVTKNKKGEGFGGVDKRLSNSFSLIHSGDIDDDDEEEENILLQNARNKNCIVVRNLNVHDLRGSMVENGHCEGPN